LAFQSFDFERTWRRLFWAYLTKVILSVPDEGYSERTWWRLYWAYLTKVILSVPDEGYSERTWRRLFWAYLMRVILSVPDEGYSERTWWRLFQKRVVRAIFYIYVFFGPGSKRWIVLVHWDNRLQIGISLFLYLNDTYLAEKNQQIPI